MVAPRQPVSTSWSLASCHSPLEFWSGATVSFDYALTNTGTKNKVYRHSEVGYIANRTVRQTDTGRRDWTYDHSPCPACSHRCSLVSFHIGLHWSMARKKQKYTPPSLRRYAVVDLVIFCFKKFICSKLCLIIHMAASIVLYCRRSLCRHLANVTVDWDRPSAAPRWCRVLTEWVLRKP